MSRSSDASISSRAIGETYAGLRVLPALEALEDAALVDAMRSQVARAPSVFFDRYAATVERLVTRILGPDGDRADVVNEVFLRALDRLDDLIEPSGLRPWLLAVTVLVARERIRSRRRARWLELRPQHRLPEVSDEGKSESANQARETLRRVYRVLDRMPDDDRVLFVLRFIEQMDLETMAKVRGVSLATVKRHLQRAEERFHTAAKRDPVLADFIARMPP
ncbi:sigma-70 family RNA polymerase sigma factor [Pendulispora brunnea]|uniref:Sigma-70 family RNA polymerase sigma factor n=1 Tax=Pendulispora brunnea TaxID=2905690 RepID=A0ABZ2KBH4_9BACT